MGDIEAEAAALRQLGEDAVLKEVPKVLKEMLDAEATSVAVWSAEGWQDRVLAAGEALAPEELRVATTWASAGTSSVSFASPPRLRHQVLHSEASVLSMPAMRSPRGRATVMFVARLSRPSVDVGTAEERMMQRLANVVTRRMEERGWAAVLAHPSDASADSDADILAKPRVSEAGATPAPITLAMAEPAPTVHTGGPPPHSMDTDEMVVQMRHVRSLFATVRDACFFECMVPARARDGPGYFSWLTEGVEPIFRATAQEMLSDASCFWLRLSDAALAFHMRYTKDLQAGKTTECIFVPMTVSMRDGRFIRVQEYVPWRDARWICIVGIIQEDPAASSVATIRALISSMPGCTIAEVEAVVDPAKLGQTGYIETCRFTDVQGDLSVHGYPLASLLGRDPRALLVHPSHKELQCHYEAGLALPEGGRCDAGELRIRYNPEAPDAPLDADPDWNVATEGVPVATQIRCAAREPTTNLAGEPRERVRLQILDQDRTAEVRSQLQAQRHYAKQAELADDLARFIYTANAPILGVDVCLRVNAWNRALERLSGHAKADVVDTPLLDLVTADSRALVATGLRRALDGDVDDTMELRIVGRDGAPFVVLIHASTTRTSDGEVTGVLGVGQDVTSLVAFVDEMRMVMDHSTDALIFFTRDADGDAVIREASRACEPLFRVPSRAGLLGRRLVELCHPDDVMTLRRAAVENSAGSDAPSGNAVWRLPSPEDGVHRSMETTISKTDSGDGIAISRDVTELMQLHRARLDLTRQAEVRRKDVSIAAFTRGEIKNGITSARRRVQAHLRLLDRVLLDQGAIKPLRSSPLEMRRDVDEADSSSVLSGLSNASTLDSVGALGAQELFGDLLTPLEAVDAELQQTLETVMNDATVQELVHDIYTPRIEDVDEEHLRSVLSAWCPGPVVIDPLPFPTVLLDPRLLHHLVCSAVRLVNGEKADTVVAVTCVCVGEGPRRHLELRLWNETVTASPPFLRDTASLLRPNPGKPTAQKRSAAAILERETPQASKFHSGAAVAPSSSSSPPQPERAYPMLIVQKCCAALGGEVVAPFYATPAKPFTFRCPVGVRSLAATAGPPTLPDNLYLLGLDDSRTQLMALLGIFREVVPPERMLLRGSTREEVDAFVDDATAFICAALGCSEATTMKSTRAAAGKAADSALAVFRQPGASSDRPNRRKRLRDHGGTLASDDSPKRAALATKPEDSAPLARASSKPAPFFLVLLDENLHPGLGSRRRATTGSDVAQALFRRLREVVPEALDQSLLLLRSADDAQAASALRKDSGLDGFLPKHVGDLARISKEVANILAEKRHRPPAYTIVGGGDTVGSGKGEPAYTVPEGWGAESRAAYAAELEECLESIRRDLRAGKGDWACVWIALHMLKGNTLCLKGHRDNVLVSAVEALRSYSNEAEYPPDEVWEPLWDVVQAECAVQLQVVAPEASGANLKTP